MKRESTIGGGFDVDRVFLSMYPVKILGARLVHKPQGCRERTKGDLSVFYNVPRHFRWNAWFYQL